MAVKEVGFISLKNLKTRDVNGTRISRVPKIFPVPGKEISRTGIFGKSFKNANAYTVRSQLSGDVINLGGHAVWLAGDRSTLLISPAFNVHTTSAVAANAVSIVLQLVSCLL